MAFGNRQWLRVHHTKPSTLGWSVVVGLYKLMTQPFSKAMENQPVDLLSYYLELCYCTQPITMKTL